MRTPAPVGVDVLDALDAAAVHAWSASALATMERHCTELDALNVFPIPDGDTGTNLVLTLRAALSALDGTEQDGAESMRRLARGAVLGALGNSGGIMSQLLVSLSRAVTDAGVFDAAALGAGLRRGAIDARAAVRNPVEGTILTVARAAAEASATGSLAVRAAAALAAADVALQATTGQLAELSRAGVVDAGGLGLVLMLEALVATVDGGRGGARQPGADLAGRPCSFQSSPFAYEVQYLLDADADAAGIEVLRGDLDELGDSVVVVGTGDGVWNVHAHVDDVGAAIEAGIVLGRPHRISVNRFADQIERRNYSHAGGAADQGSARPATTGSAVVVVAPGAGLAALFAGEGVSVVIGAQPDVLVLRQQLHAPQAAAVVLLPNSVRVRAAAEAAAELARGDGLRVSVIATRSPVQGLAAVAVHDPRRRFDDDVVAMAEAAAATRFAEVAIAEKQSLTSVGICAAGDLLGLIDGEVVEIGHGLLSVAFSLIDRLLAVGPELITVLVGASAPPGTGALVDRHVRERSPFTEVSVYVVAEPGADEAGVALVIGAE